MRESTGQPAKRLPFAAQKENAPNGWVYRSGARDFVMGKSFDCEKNRRSGIRATASVSIRVVTVLSRTAWRRAAD